MMKIATKFPITLAERIELGAGLVTFPATWEEFLDLLEIAEYRIEYDKNQITTMSTASDPHEAIVKNLMVLFSNAMDEAPNIHVRGSNRPVQIVEKKVYNPDIHVTKEQPQLIEYRKGLTANSNPWIIVEVLSLSTEYRDWRTKLPNYKNISTVKYILYVDQYEPFVSYFKRKGTSSVWENIDYHELTQSFQIEDYAFSLTDIYKKVVFNTD